MASAPSSASLVQSAYLDEQSAKTRGKAIPWEGYQRANLLTPEEVSLIKRVDRQPRAKVEQLYASTGEVEQYARLYLTLLSKLVKVDTLQSVLVLLDDLVDDNPERLKLLLEWSRVEPSYPWGPLIKALETPDEFTQLKSLRLLTLLLTTDGLPSLSDPLPPHIQQPLVRYTTDLLSSHSISPGAKDTALSLLAALLSRAGLRRPFYDAGAPAPLVALLKEEKQNPQTLYTVAYALWLFTFDREIARDVDGKYHVIPLLTEVVKSAVKEKVVRVSIATFRNLVQLAAHSTLSTFLALNLLPTLTALQSRKWGDDDLVEDLSFLVDQLKERFASASNWDAYKSELDSGLLHWSPVHRDEGFWKEEGGKLAERDAEGLKKLVHLLKTSNDPTVLAVAAHDVGQFVKHVERGKQLVTDLSAKTRVMELMQHESPEVRYEALVTTQRLVSHSWQS